MNLRRWSGPALFAVVFLVPGGLVAGSLLHVFRSAKTAAQRTRELTNCRRLSRAVLAYVKGHKGRLPGPDWRKELEKVDGGLAGILRKAGDDETKGYAAVPGTMGKVLDQLPAKTIVYVDYPLWGMVEDRSETSGFFLTVDDVRGGSARVRRIVRWQ